MATHLKKDNINYIYEIIEDIDFNTVESKLNKLLDNIHFHNNIEGLNDLYFHLDYILDNRQNMIEELDNNHSKILEEMTFDKVEELETSSREINVNRYYIYFLQNIKLELIQFSVNNGYMFSSGFLTGKGIFEELKQEV